MSLMQVVLAKESRQLVFGWGNVCAMPDGKLIKDYQEQAIRPEDLEYANYDYVLKSGVIAFRHQKDAAGRPIPVGRIVECMFFSPEKLVALSKVAKDLGLKGVEPDALPQGVWIGAHIFSKDLWLDAAQGRLPMFSVGGGAKVVKA